MIVLEDIVLQNGAVAKKVDAVKNNFIESHKKRPFHSYNLTIVKIKREETYEIEIAPA